MDAEEGPASRLMALGLSGYEAKVYLALIRRESYTAAQVAREADVPRQRVYDVLDALVRRQLATTRPGRVATFSAVAPELALSRLMGHQRACLERLERTSQALAAALGPIWSDGRSQDNPLDYVEVLRDPRAIADRFADIQVQADRELLSFCKPPYLTPTANTEGITTVRRLRRAGGTVRAIYTYDSLDDTEMQQNVVRFGEAGEEARCVAELPLKLVIADASQVLCDMPDPVAGTGSTTALFIDHPALATCLRLAFDTTWRQAQPIPGPRAASG